MAADQFLRYKLRRKQTGTTIALHLSDLHFKAKTFGDGAEHRALKHVEAAIKSALDGRKLDLILVTGDVIDGETWDTQVDLDTLRKAKEYLHGLCEVFRVNQSGLIVIGGNHDFKWKGITTGKWAWLSSGETQYQRMVENFAQVFPD